MRLLDRIAVISLITGGALLWADGAAAQASASQLSQMYQQMQQLQREVMELRGVVEEQGYRIRKLEKQRIEDYQNLDRRLQEQGAGGAAPRPVQESKAPSSAAAETAAVAAGGAAGAAAAKSGGSSEREAYQAAFQLLKQQDFKRAEQAFSRFVADYPNGRYSANAYYWLGELYLTGNNLSQARDTFRILVSRYPSFRKTPESSFKLAKIYHQLGDATAAETLLTRIAADYRTSSPETAKAASEYLQEHFR